MTRIFFFLAALTLCATPALAITYYEDPVYKPVSPEDHHPMEDMIMMAEEGDIRAQYILGDLFAKGKGGFVKSEEKASKWFQMSARNGNGFAFIRLAALAKHSKKWGEAYQWYSLAIDRLPFGNDRKWASTQRDLLEKEKKVDSNDIKAARKAASDWKDKASDLLKEDQASYPAKKAENDAKREAEAAKAAKSAPKKSEPPKPAEGEKAQ